MCYNTKTLKCSDLGAGPECKYEATGETNEEVIGKMFQHAGEVHKDKVEGMSEEDKAGMVTKMNEILDKQ